MNNIVFLHIPKTGGTTLKNILNKNFEREKVVNIIVTKNGLTSNEFFDLTEKERREIKFLSGHIYFGIHNHFQNKEEIKYVSFLRNPIEQVGSSYYYSRSRNGGYFNDPAPKMNIQDYVRLGPDKKHELHNIQTRIIAGVESPADGDYHNPALLEKAIQNIERYFLFVGVNEFFNESIVIMQKMLGLKKVYFVKARKTKNKKSRTYNELFDQKTCDIILKNNALDYELWKYVCNKVKSEIKRNKVSKLDLLILRLKNLLFSGYFTFRNKIS